MYNGDDGDTASEACSGTMIAIRKIKMRVIYNVRIDRILLFGIVFSILIEIGRKFLPDGTRRKPQARSRPLQG